MIQILCRNRPWWPSGLRLYLKFKQRECLARDYDIDPSEVEILCRYSNSRAPGDMCCLRYRTERDAIVPKNWYQFVGNSNTYKAQDRWRCGCVNSLLGTKFSQQHRHQGSSLHPTKLDVTIFIKWMLYHRATALWFFNRCQLNTTEQFFYILILLESNLCEFSCNSFT